MNGGHDTALDRSVVVKSLSHRSEAVGGAGSSGNDGVILSKGLLINAVNDSRKIISCGSGNYNFLSACVDVSLALSLGAIEAGALENYVNAELSPGKISSVGLSVNCDLLAVNDDGAGSNNSLAILCIYSGLAVYGVLVLADLSAVAALSGIILEKVSEHFRLSKVVDCYYLVAISVEHLSESKTADSAETINCNFY